MSLQSVFNQAEAEYRRERITADFERHPARGRRRRASTADTAAPNRSVTPGQADLGPAPAVRSTPNGVSRKPGVPSEPAGSRGPLRRWRRAAPVAEAEKVTAGR